MRPLHRSLGFRLLLFVGISLILLLGFGNWFTFRLQEQHVVDETLTAMDSMAELACYTSMQHMIDENPEKVQSTIDEIVANSSGIKAIRIMDKEGVIKKTTVDGERGKRLPMTSESCTLCHRGIDPREAPASDKHAMIVPSATVEHREAQLYYAVHNKKSCSTRCHESHDDGQRVLGVFQITMPLTVVDERIASTRSHLVMISAGSFLLIMAILAATLLQYYIRPINALLTGIRNISGGKFNRSIPVYRKDEFGYLSRSLNQMVQTLDRDIAYRKLLLYTGSAPQKETSMDQGQRDEDPDLRDEVDVETSDVEVGATFEEMYKLLQDETHIKLVRAVKLASLGQLSAGIAHEINNPLTAVLSYSSLLLERAQTDKDREWLEIVVSEAKRCRNIVAGLLEFSRQSLPEKTATQVNDIIARAIILVEHKESFHNITFVKNLDPKLPRISIDRGQIYQVLTNLIINAGDAMDGKGTLTIGSRVHTIESKFTESRRYIEVSVTDTGCGIEPQNLERVFDPFFTTKGPTMGTGLGLSICFGIIKRHGGNITLESTRDVGSTFTVHLPIKKESDREDD